MGRSLEPGGSPYTESPPSASVTSSRVPTNHAQPPGETKPSFPDILAPGGHPPMRTRLGRGHPPLLLARSPLRTSCWVTSPQRDRTTRSGTSGARRRRLTVDRSGCTHRTLAHGVEDSHQTGPESIHRNQASGFHNVARAAKVRTAVQTAG